MTGAERKKLVEFRMHVPVLRETAYLQTAETGLIPDFVHDGIARYQEDRYLRTGDSRWELPDGRICGTLAMMDWAKQQLAAMIGGEKENIFFGNNSGQVYTVVTSGMRFSAGDNVVLVENSWMGNRFAWQIRQADGLEIRYAKKQNGRVDLEELFALCDNRTRAVCVSLVESGSGFRIDAEAIGAYCHEHHIWFVADGVQALGVLPINVKATKIDFLVGNDYKWMMNYCGTGYAYISPDLMADIGQLGAGWMSDDERFRTDKQVLHIREDAGRFELGYPTVSGIYGLGLTAAKYLDFGGTLIHRYVNELSTYLLQGVAAIEGIQPCYSFTSEEKSAIHLLSISGSRTITDEMQRKAKTAVNIRTASDGNTYARISLHYYNNLEDIDRFLTLVDAK